MEFKFWNRPLAPEQVLPLAADWFEQDLGRSLLASQQQLLNEVLVDCFGYHLLQLSVLPQLELALECRVQRKHRVHPQLSHQSVEALCEFQQLPFATESLDVVILHHVQEFVADPHQLLREVQRVVVPHGHIILLGFNPWSALGAYGRLARMAPASIWHNHMLSSYRVKDWFALLGFQVQQLNFGFHQPRIIEQRANPAVKTLLKNWPTGSFYMISALKQVEGMTPQRPRWKQPVKPFVSLTPVKSRVTQQNSTITLEEEVA